MKISHFAPEIHPFTTKDRRGIHQLGANIAALAEFTAARGHELSVFTPLYSQIDIKKHKLQASGEKTWVTLKDNLFEFEIYKVQLKGVTYYFLGNEELFNRREIYGCGGVDYTDNDVRFAAYCQAALNYINYSLPDTDIIHMHNWPAAFAAVFTYLRYSAMPWKLVLTVHDLSSQGIFTRFSMENLGLPWEMYTLDQLEFYENINILKGGVVYSDLILGLAYGHAESFLMNETSLGLVDTFRQHQKKLGFISNGIDYEKWNPQTDPRLVQNYSADELDKRALNKKEFCGRYDLDYDKPLFVVMSRYVPRQGIDFIMKIVPDFIKDKKQVNFFLYGRGEKPYEKTLKDWAQKFSNIRVVPEDDAPIYHNLLAAADFMITPYASNSMGKERRMAMRYGAVPMIRSFHKYTDSAASMDDEPIIFKHYSMEDLLNNIDKAETLFYNRERMAEYVQRLMRQDHSWLTTAKLCEKYYQTLLQ